MCPFRRTASFTITTFSHYPAELKAHLLTPPDVAGVSENLLRSVLMGTYVQETVY
jgi:hypothetical protein